MYEEAILMVMVSINRNALRIRCTIWASITGVKLTCFIPVDFMINADQISAIGQSDHDQMQMIPYMRSISRYFNANHVL
jgi:hypothetical protein